MLFIVFPSILMLYLHIQRLLKTHNYEQTVTISGDGKDKELPVKRAAGFLVLLARGHKVAVDTHMRRLALCSED